MNAELYEKWFEEKVLPRLTEPTIIVLGNVGYHSRMVETRPSYHIISYQFIDATNRW
jgi:hypothetical protein